MENFIDYANYYNLLYKDKDYKKEVGYIDSLIKKYGKNSTKEILDIGCGTGNHDIFFAEKGYRVSGIDKSPEMIKIAKSNIHKKNNIKFYLSDCAIFNLKKKFDLVVSLFHVMNYLATNDSLYNTFKNIYRHLKEGGLFIFDFWYGPAVLLDRPQVRTKKIEDKAIEIKRVATPAIDVNKNTVDISFKVAIRDKKTGQVKRINENHKLKYLFLPELDFMLTSAGFKIIKSLKWLSLNEDISCDTWYGLLIARKQTIR